MWCPRNQIEINCHGICVNCGYFPNQFNYECPDCKGKFNAPGQRYSYNEQGMWNEFKTCPFCNKKMEGLS
jgi:hypothetical protein